MFEFPLAQGWLCEPAERLVDLGRGPGFGGSFDRRLVEIWMDFFAARSLPDLAAAFFVNLFPAGSPQDVEGPFSVWQDLSNGLRVIFGMIWVY